MRAERPRLRGQRRPGAGTELQRVRAALRARRRRRAPAPTSSTRSGSYATADYDCGAAFRCSWDPKTPFDWTADGDQAATQLFYFVNRFHDHLESRARDRVHAGQLRGQRPGGGPGAGRRAPSRTWPATRPASPAPSTRTTPTCWCSPRARRQAGSCRCTSGIPRATRTSTRSPTTGRCTAATIRRSSSTSTRTASPTGWSPTPRATAR